jgi:hypothetical protein
MKPHSENELERNMEGTEEKGKKKEEGNGKEE